MGRWRIRAGSSYTWLESRSLKLIECKLKQGVSHMGQPAARIDDDVMHRHGSGRILQGCPTVRIGGVSLFAARILDKVQHGDGKEPIAEGEPTVRIGGADLFAARLGDKVACAGVIAQGCPTVRIGRDRDEDCLKAAASQGDMTISPES